MSGCGGLLYHLPIHNDLDGELLFAGTHLLGVAANQIGREHPGIYTLQSEVLRRNALDRTILVHGRDRPLELDAGVTSDAKYYALISAGVGLTAAALLPLLSSLRLLFLCRFVFLFGLLGYLTAATTTASCCYERGDEEDEHTHKS